MNTLQLDITNILNNSILDADSYKMCHFSFMQKGTNRNFAYVEPRKGGAFAFIVPFGLQYHLKKYLTAQITRFMIDQAEVFAMMHGEPFNREGWEYILEKHNGYLPLRIRSVDEGLIIPEGNVMITVENTDFECSDAIAAFLSTYVETGLLRAAWYGSSVATRSYVMRKIILNALEETGDPALIDFALIDFGSRGVSSKETSQIGGAAHLAVGNMGTDNIVGILHAMAYYSPLTVVSELPGYSIPATEHSVTTARGEEGELDFFSEIIDTKLGPGKMVSVVIDTYDRKKAVKKWGMLKDKLIAKGGTVRLRPDSGIPYQEVLRTVKELDKYFGSTVNSKGYKVLNPCIRVIQGDGIDIPMLKKILQVLKKNGYSADNVNFGCGGYLLQALNRDTQRFAMKSSYIEVNGIGKDIRKIPKTDPTKASKAGILELIERDGKIMTVTVENVLPTDKLLLKTRFENGKLYNEITFAEVRANVKNSVAA